MCRIAGYFGEPVALSALLSEPPRALRVQAKTPRELPPGMVGSDGHGVGWFDGDAPARYRSVLPIWSDANVDGMAPHVRASCFVASSRTASDHMPVGMANTPPFRCGPALLVHNGTIEKFQPLLLERLRAHLSADSRSDVLGNTDSEYLAALLRERLHLPLVEAVRETWRLVVTETRGAGVSAQLNAVVARANELVVVRYADGTDAPSLYARSTAHAVTAASEKMDDEAWTALEAGEIWAVTGSADALRVTRTHV